MIEAVLPVIATALLGSYFTKQGVDTPYYQDKKSPLTPPNYVFPIVWTCIYTMLIFVLYLSEQKGALYMNLVLNVVWCYAFFYIQQPKLALLLIILLWLNILYIILEPSELLWIRIGMLGYLTWVTFAAYLNYFACTV